MTGRIALAGASLARFVRAWQICVRTGWLSTITAPPFGDSLLHRYAANLKGVESVTLRLAVCMAGMYKGPVTSFAVLGYAADSIPEIRNIFIHRRNLCLVAVFGVGGTSIPAWSRSTRTIISTGLVGEARQQLACVDTVCLP